MHMLAGPPLKKRKINEVSESDGTESILNALNVKAENDMLKVACTGAGTVINDLSRGWRDEQQSIWVIHDIKIALYSSSMKSVTAYLLPRYSEDTLINKLSVIYKKLIKII